MHQFISLLGMEEKSNQPAKVTPLALFVWGWERSDAARSLHHSLLFAS